MNLTKVLLFFLILASLVMVVSCEQESGSGSSAETDGRGLEEERYKGFLKKVKEEYGNANRREAFLYLRNRLLKCRADVNSCLEQNPGPVPVDCEVSMWGQWSQCFGGDKVRTRTVIREANNGGEACPVLMDSIDCAEFRQDPPDAANFTAEEKRAFKQNIITLKNIYRSADIKNMYIYMNQQLDACYERFNSCKEEKETPIDCSVSDWSDWSTCMNGQESRQRVVVVEPVNNGSQCPVLVETRSCAITPAPTAPPAYPSPPTTSPPAYPSPPTTSPPAYPSPPTAPPAYPSPPTSPPAYPSPPTSPPTAPPAGPPAPPF